VVRLSPASIPALAAAAIFGSGAAPVAGDPPPAPPGVVLILADDLGYADLGIHGSPELRTPNLDAIARDGILCTDAYVSAPQCTPCRAGLLTGRYPQRFGYARNQARRGLPPDERTLAEVLRDAGYATAAIGKWHLGGWPECHPREHGFDEFFGFVGGVSAYLPSPVTHSVPRILRNTAPVRVPQELTTAFGAEAAAFVARNRDGPFFLYLAFSAPHYPLEATPDAIARVRLPDGPRRTYVAMVETMDAAIGAVRDALRDAGRDDDTLLFFLSDNGGATHLGGASNAPFRGAKKTLLEGGIRVPFLARWPDGLPRGVLRREPILQLDVFPTVLAAAGVRPDGLPLDGVDLLPPLASGAPGGREHVFWRFAMNRARDDRQWAARAGPLKLLRLPGADPILTDLARDPEERRDLAAERPEDARRLLEAWKTWNATLPEEWSELGAGDAADD